MLTHRIAHLIHNGVHPSKILAITFTNKAAAEMRERVGALVGPVVKTMWVSTFHSACVRILRANADLPENYEARPEAFRFIVDVPTDWEQSIALAGEVGDYVVFARQERGGEDWYLGAVTDEEARTVQVPLDFLEPGRPYTAQIYRDGEGADWKTNPYAITVEERAVGHDEVLSLWLAPGGGAAVRFAAGETE